MYFVLNVCALHRFQSTFYSKIAASCIVFLIYIASIFINMPQQCFFSLPWLLFKLAEKTPTTSTNKGRSEYVYIVPTICCRLDFCYDFCPFFTVHTHASQCTSVCYSLQHTYVYSIYFISIFSGHFFLNQSEDLAVESHSGVSI